MTRDSEHSDIRQAQGAAPHDTVEAALARQLAGESSAEDRAALATWLGIGTAEIDSVVRMSESAPTLDPMRSRAAVMARVRSSASLQPTTSTRVARDPATRRRYGWHWFPAVGLGAAALAVIVVSHTFDGTQHPRVVREYVTQPAQRATISLPDGSRMTLAPVSHATYVQEASGARTITLDGAAYFDVTHDARRSFAVRTGAIITRVLGTTFSVRRYTGEATTQVAVVAGKVSSGGVGTPLLLTRGMVGEITDSSATRHDGDGTGAATAWTRGELVFRETPVSAVLAAVERWSGYQFRVNDSSITQGSVTTTLLVTDPQETLRVLQELLNVRMDYDGRVITLSPRARARQGTAVRPRPGLPEMPRTHALSTSHEVGK